MTVVLVGISVLTVECIAGFFSVRADCLGVLVLLIRADCLGVSVFVIRADCLGV